MKVAFVHEWLLNRAGSEKVLEAMLEGYPGSPIYSLLFDSELYRDSIISAHPVHTSFMAHLPRSNRFYRYYLPFAPLAVEQHDVSGFDVVISSSHAVAKGVITGPDQLHVSYVHSPIRYAWDLQHQYLAESGIERGVRSWLARIMLHRMRIWDTRTSNGVDHFLANSHFIARRIWKAYRREAKVIYPPVDVDSFALEANKEDFYLTASRLVPYKRVGTIVEAFADLPERRLVVVGDGPELQRIKSKAGRNVEILGHQPFHTLRDLMQRAKGFIFAAEEDFGITPVEAQACGTPVLAYGRGGSRETVIAGVTGMFFDEQTPAAIRDAVHEFERINEGIDPQRVRQHAELFSQARFKQEFAGAIAEYWESFKLRRGF